MYVFPCHDDPRGLKNTTETGARLPARRARYPRSIMTVAVRSVLTLRKNIKEAARLYGIPRSTLHKHVRKARAEHQRLFQHGLKQEQTLETTDSGISEDFNNDDSKSSWALDDSMPSVSWDDSSLMDSTPSGMDYFKNEYPSSDSGNDTDAAFSIFQKPAVYITLSASSEEESKTVEQCAESSRSNKEKLEPPEDSYEVSDNKDPKGQCLLIKDKSGNIVRQVLLKYKPSTGYHVIDNRKL